MRTICVQRDMMDTSLSNWQRYKWPGAHFENGLLVKGDADPQEYYPAEYQSKILNSLLRISDENTAIEFARSWGLLGLNLESKKISKEKAFGWLLTEKLDERITGNFDNKIGKTDFKPYIKESMDRYIEPDIGEKLSHILRFTQATILMAEIQKIRRTYSEIDAEAGKFEAEEWIENTKNEKLLKDFDFFPIELVKENWQRANWGTKDYYKYLLDFLIIHERKRFSESDGFSVNLELNHRYFPREPDSYLFNIKFSSLSAFITYTVLFSPSVLPKICADPQCRQLFFAQKPDQRYCPPPPGGKRSRCEGRHSQQLKREKISGKNT